MHHTSFSRRDLLKVASGTAALGFIASWIPGGRIAYADDVGPQFKELALQALDAAKAAGAQFADVRIELFRLLKIEVGTRGVTRTPLFYDRATVGVRAVVDGAWGFAGGYDLTAANVQRVARLAVGCARGGQHRGERPFEFAPAPSVRDGVWETPIEIDPFTVPVREHEAFLIEAVQGVERLKSAQATIGSASAFNNWTKSERVFASTDGSFISQRTYKAMPDVGVTANRIGDDTLSVHVDIDSLRSGGYGYEAVSKANLKEEWRKAAEEALGIASLPNRSVDVGRYDLVLSPLVVAQILADTVGRALELDRARGEKAAGVGTTYAMPPAQTLGAYLLGNKLLTVTADRSRPTANGTVGWDEEGVKPEDFTLIKDGVVVDYITTRQTAPAIAGWYASQRQPMRSHGCATRSGSQQPILQLPNLTLQPGSARVTEEDLIRDIKKGFYVADAFGGVDQQCLNAQYAGLLVFEIRDGKRVGLARDMAFQFNTPQFWKSLNALGGAESASLEHIAVDSSPEPNSHIGVQSVPARFRQVNVVNTGKQA